ncbi:hypothetical protein YOLOSWAG_182 [Erwinia phage vB_EamM_Yoloswag]|uniref:Uncharacterized protein n=1 Tax=Erwinia phage vB_EamM_Yoloswag TaxID=1958956 RepID=A0A1S6L393_9CAUD|nr:hypothetical protein HOR66_gp182 [Erwinia phage vB_EamM_Yoloswag]AQT28661.1 hypothetical protein YOLOSWAG_182 [Erwinia phage vB_EamM_Yoloswag]
MEIVVSLSALPPSLYRKFVKGWKPNPTLLKLFEQISGKRGRKAMRIYIDAKTDNVIKNIVDNVKPPKLVEDELRLKDIEIVDYVAGTGKDRHGRVVRIGRALKSAEAKKAFDSDPQRKSLTNATRNHQLICISMHPYDIAGMSTDRGWTSCMHLVDGSNRKYVGHDINQGTLIAYLIEPKDRNINKPIARCLAKPFYERTKGVKNSQLKIGGKVNAMYLVEYAYPDSTMPFVHTLQAWLDEHINPKIAASPRQGVYELAPKLYDDKRGAEYVYDLEQPLAKGDLKTFVDQFVNHRDRLLDGVNTEEFDIARRASQRYPKIPAMLALAGWKTARWSLLADDMIRTDKLQEFQDLSRALVTTTGSDSKYVLDMWRKSSRSVKAMDMFLQILPDSDRENFFNKHLFNIIPYSYSREDHIKGGYPKALSEIWTLVKDTADAERNFWYTASRINNDNVVPADIEEEYDDEDEMQTECIAPAVISLANRVGESPASLESLERNREHVLPEYFKYASEVFKGYKPVHMDALRGGDYLNLVSSIAEETGAKEFTVSYVVENHNFSRYRFNALDDLYPVYGIIDPESRTSTAMVKSDDSASTIADKVFETALAEYRADIILDVKAEMEDGEDDDIPDMSDDDDDWDDAFEDPEEGDDDEDEPAPTPARANNILFDDEDEDDDDVGEWDDSWMDDADIGAPDMSDNDELSEEAELAQFLARQARDNR